MRRWCREHYSASFKSKQLLGKAPWYNKSERVNSRPQGSVGRDPPTTFCISSPITICMRLAAYSTVQHMLRYHDPMTMMNDDRQGTGIASLIWDDPRSVF
jgi:hypothetical protein